MVIWWVVSFFDEDMDVLEEVWEIVGLCGCGWVVKV